MTHEVEYKSYIGAGGRVDSTSWDCRTCDFSQLFFEDLSAAELAERHAAFVEATDDPQT